MWDLSLDGGGTKINALLFDENYRVLARGHGSGVNTTQNSPEQAEESVRQCLDQVLPQDLSELDTVYAVFVGDAGMLERVLRRRVPRIGKIVFLGEGASGLLAGSGRRTGLLALAGTGSDIFYVHEETATVWGGLGPVLGDQGSGAWIALQAVRAVGREHFGWGEKTALTGKVFDYFRAGEDIWKVVARVYESGQPFRAIAPVTRLVGEAAREGDTAALRILEEAGRSLGIQLNALLRKDPLRPGEDTVTLCGGAWKSHPVMREAFQREIRREHPELKVHRPWFEQVVSGLMEKALSRGYTREEAYALLAENCGEELLNPFEG